MFSFSLDELSKIFDHKLLLTEAETEMFLENSCTFYEGQIILLKGTLMKILKITFEKWILNTKNSRVICP